MLRGEVRDVVDVSIFACFAWPGGLRGFGFDGCSISALHLRLALVWRSRMRNCKKLLELGMTAFCT